MEAKELRIGNKIQDDSEFIFDVVGIGEDWVTADFPENEGDVWEFDFKHSFPWPIPITKEILMQYGAKDNSHKQLPSFNIDGMEINFIDGMWIEYVSRIEIRGFHHLQNIFYFRKNYELKINKP